VSRVVTRHVYPPIPCRAFDWEASLEGREGDEDAPRGWGATEAEAVADLTEQLEDCACNEVANVA
jgi:hypothetical protein